MWELVQTIAALALVCTLAYLVLRFGFGRLGRATRGGSLRMIARLPLEPRRSVYLIEAAGRCFLVGSAEAGVTMIAEVAPPPAETPAPAPTGR